MIDAQAQRCIFAGAIQLLASMNPATLKQQDAAMDSAATLALDMWQRVEAFTTGEESSKVEVFQPHGSRDKITYMDPEEIEHMGPVTHQDLVDGGFVEAPLKTPGQLVTTAQKIAEGKA